MEIFILHQRSMYPVDSSRSGESLRVQQLKNGLGTHGYRVVTLCKEECTKKEINARIMQEKPACTIVMHAAMVELIEDPGHTIVLDLYAQRMMEALFEQSLNKEVMELIRVLPRCSLFLVSNHRQRRSWHGVLAMLGAKLHPSSVLVVPLAVTRNISSETPHRLHLVGGGRAWPWQNPWSAMQRALTHLDKRETGTITWVGTKVPIHHPRLQVQSFGSFDDFLTLLCRGSAAFDWMEHNIEREYAIAFRHMSYVSSGIPILTGSYSPLGELGEGFFSSNDNIEEVLDRCIDQPSWLEDAAQKSVEVAQSLSAEKTTRVLSFSLKKISPLQWEGSPLHEPSQLWKELLDARIAQERLQRHNEDLLEDLAKKSNEISVQNKSIAEQRTAIAQLSQSVAQVVSYRREVVQILGGQVTQHSNAHEAMEQENAILRADIAKKSAELAAMDQLVVRLENDIQSLRKEFERRKGLFRRG